MNSKKLAAEISVTVIGNVKCPLVLISYRSYQ